MKQQNGNPNTSRTHRMEIFPTVFKQFCSHLGKPLYIFKRNIQKGLSTLSQMPEEQVFSQITNRRGESGLASVIGTKLIPLVTI